MVPEALAGRGGRRGARVPPHSRLLDKDAHDIYRLLVATDATTLGARLAELSRDDLAGPSTELAISYLRELFADASSLGPVIAGRRADGETADPTD